MNYKQYQQEVTADIASVLAEASCQPILFIGSGFTRRYAGGPNWEELLRKLAAGCPLIDKDFAYYKQAYNGDLKKTVRYSRTSIASGRGTKARAHSRPSTSLRHSRATYSSSTRSPSC